MNALEMLTAVRENIGEPSAAHWTDNELLRHLSAAQSSIAAELYMVPMPFLVKSASVTPSASVIDMPADCAWPVHLEETDTKYPIFIDTILQDKNLTRYPGGSLQREAYIVGRTIVVNADNFTTPCTLYYQCTPPPLLVGTATAGGENSITLDSQASPQEDLYVGTQLQITGGTGEDTISTITAYSANREATLEGTFDDTSEYATISILPLQAHNVIIALATVNALAKPSSAIDPAYYEQARERYRQEWTTFKLWASGLAVRHVRITDFVNMNPR